MASLMKTIQGRVKPYCDAIIAATNEAANQYALAQNRASMLVNDLTDVQTTADAVAQEAAYVANFYNAGVQAGQFTRLYILQQGVEHIQSVYQAAIDACQVLSDTGASIARNLSAANQIAKPAGLDPQTMSDYERNLERILQPAAAQGSTYLLKAYGDRLKAALNAQDMATAYVLVSPVMGLWLESYKFPDDLRQKAITDAVGNALRPDGTPVPGADLFALLDGGGAHSLQGILTTYRHALYMDMEGLIDLMRGLAAQNGIEQAAIIAPLKNILNTVQSAPAYSNEPYNQAMRDGGTL